MLAARLKQRRWLEQWIGHVDRMRQWLQLFISLRMSDITKPQGSEVKPPAAGSIYLSPSVSKASGVDPWPAITPNLHFYLKQLVAVLISDAVFKGA